MKMRISLCSGTSALAVFIAVMCGAASAPGQQPVKMDASTTAPPDASLSTSLGPPLLVQSEDPGEALSSVEQGKGSFTDSFEERREWRLEKRREALQDTKFDFNFRTFYFDRKKFDGSESQSWAVGGWGGFKTGYFLDHVALGATVYTSQNLYGPSDKDGSLLLKPGQDGYTVLGEAYADIRIIDDLNLYVGRKGFDTPYINRNDNRMTPNTFEAIVLQGKIKFGASEAQAVPDTNDGKASVNANEGKAGSSANDATLKYGVGYFDRIKERNSDRFVSMAEDAGAKVERGVFTAGALYEKGNYSLGAIDYYCADVINIGYVEAKVKIPVNDDWQPKLAFQFTDQRSVGSDLLQANGFSVQQFGVRAELPWKKQALFTVGYTKTGDGNNMQSPWGGYPGYTSVQVQDFNRAGEGAFLLRAGYEFPQIKGLSAYALGVFGTAPSQAGQFRQNEYDANLQWAPPEGFLKGFSIRLRYALVDEFGGAANNLKDFRVIANYAISF